MVRWIIILMVLLSSCYGTYHLTDAEYSDVRESHTSVTYYDNQIYWGWSSGYYYYYGTPHYYPWYYYYNSCPPSHHTHKTHFIVKNPVIKPTHRPNINNHRPNIRTNGNTKVKNNTRVTVTPKTNYTRPNTTRVKTNRNNSNKSTNKTFNIKTNNRKNTRKPR